MTDERQNKLYWGGESRAVTNRCEGDNTQHDAKAEGYIPIIVCHMPQKSKASMMLALLQYL